MKNFPFKIGYNYKINETIVYCVKIKTFKQNNLKGFTIVIFKKDDIIYKVNRWFDGSLGRITKDKINNNQIIL